MLAASIILCSRGNDVVLLLCCTNSPNPCGSCPSLDEVGDRGIAGSIFSGDISNLGILVAAAVALAESSWFKRAAEMRRMAWRSLGSLRLRERQLAGQKAARRDEGQA